MIKKKKEFENPNTEASVAHLDAQVSRFLMCDGPNM